MITSILKVEKMSTKHAAEAFPGSYTLPLQSGPGPLRYSRTRSIIEPFKNMNKGAVIFYEEGGHLYVGGRIFGVV